MYISHPLLNHISRFQLIKEFAIFLTIKSLHRNSVIYTQKSITKTLSTKLNCSRTKANRIIHIMLSQGWAKKEHGHLILNTIRSIHFNLFGKKPKYFVKINSTEDIYLQLLANKLKRKKYIKDKVSILQSCWKKITKSAYKKLKERKHFVDVGTSIKTVSKEFGLSPSRTCQILKQLEKKSFISIIRRRQRLGVFSPESFDCYKQQFKGLYIEGKFMYYNLTSIIKPLHNPFTQIGSIQHNSIL